MQHNMAHYCVRSNVSRTALSASWLQPACCHSEHELPILQTIRNSSCESIYLSATRQNSHILAFVEPALQSIPAAHPEVQLPLCQLEEVRRAPMPPARRRSRDPDDGTETLDVVQRLTDRQTEAGG